ncbi:RNA polymerase sigma-70 factor [Pinibacter aurantiacus]|uniref:RNA polymerase sigma-70 factor n=1 Tax=Pinibacter aurantiacus TaxID=2851599 RepID=A0A9E2W606_9BACT|nr:RNA polymerase sigma-70 factor [Pinibacter aurantiacus]MBV4359253.1 RNA polymerase sigma-70 factor [Pinibacter aurantiacus]
MQEALMHNELFVRLAAEDEQAFRQLFHYYTPRLQPFVFSIVKSDAVAEEIVQDVFLRLWTNRESVARKDNPSSWLFTVASNLSISYLRKKSIERRFIEKVKEEMVELRQQNMIEEEMFLRENQELLKRAIDTLSPQQKLAYTLSRNEGLAHKEIAERLGISPNTVKNHIVNAVHSITDFIRKATKIFFSILLVVFLH